MSFGFFGWQNKQKAHVATIIDTLLEEQAKF